MPAQGHNGIGREGAPGVGERAGGAHRRPGEGLRGDGEGGGAADGIVALHIRDSDGGGAHIGIVAVGHCVLAGRNHGLAVFYNNGGFFLGAVIDKAVIGQFNGRVADGLGIDCQRNCSAGLPIIAGGLNLGGDGVGSRICGPAGGRCAACFGGVGIFDLCAGGGCGGLCRGAAIDNRLVVEYQRNRRWIDGQRSRLINNIVVVSHVRAAAVLDLSGGGCDGAAGDILGAGIEGNTFQGIAGAKSGGSYLICPLGDALAVGDGLVVSLDGQRGRGDGDLA